MWIQIPSSCPRVPVPDRSPLVASENQMLPTTFMSTSCYYGKPRHEEGKQLSAQQVEGGDLDICT